jgi:hypothetical protein
MTSVRVPLAFLTVSLTLAALVRAADGPVTFAVGEFTFTRPAAWQWVEPMSSMRKAQMKIPGAKKDESGELVFFHFGPGDGGGTQANVDRWLGQFQEPRPKINAKVEEVTAGKLKITYVQAEGTYAAAMPGHPARPQPNAMLLGAILESAQGNVFIKLTGPKPLVSAAREPFRKMVEGAVKTTPKA